MLKRVSLCFNADRVGWFLRSLCVSSHCNRGYKKVFRNQRKKVKVEQHQLDCTAAKIGLFKREKRWLKGKLWKSDGREKWNRRLISVKTNEESIKIKKSVKRLPGVETIRWKWRKSNIAARRFKWKAWKWRVSVCCYNLCNNPIRWKKKIKKKIFRHNWSENEKEISSFMNNFSLCFASKTSHKSQSV